MAAAVASSLKESSLFWIRRVVLGLEGADYGLAWNHLSMNLLASGVVDAVTDHSVGVLTATKDCVYCRYKDVIWHLTKHKPSPDTPQIEMNIQSSSYGFKSGRWVSMISLMEGMLASSFAFTSAPTFPPL
jgi:hypothetical protein